MSAGRHTLAPKMTQNPLDDVRPLDTGDDLDRAATVLADLDIDLEHAPEAPGPSHGAMLLGFGRRGCAGQSLAAPGRRDLRTQAAVGCENTVIASEVDAGPWDQGRQPGDEIQWLQQHMRGAVTPGRFERVAHQTLTGQRQPAVGDRAADDVAAQSLETVALMGLDRNTGVQRKAARRGQLARPFVVQTNRGKRLQRKRLLAAMRPDRDTVSDRMTGQLVQR